MTGTALNHNLSPLLGLSATSILCVSHLYVKTVLRPVTTNENDKNMKNTVSRPIDTNARRQCIITPYNEIINQGFTQ